MQKKIHIPKHPIKFLWFASKPHFGWGIVAILAVTVAESLSSVTPYFFGRIVDKATAVSGIASPNYSEVWFWAAIYVISLTIIYGSFRLSGFIGMQWLSRMNATAYTSLYDYLSKHSHTFFANRFAGALTNKISHAADGAENFGENFLWHYYPTLISFIVSGIFIFATNVPVGLIYSGLIIILISLNYPLVLYRRPFVVTYANESSALRGQAVDIATNMAAVHQFARRIFEMSRLGKQIEKKRLADIAQWRISEGILLLNNTLIALGIGSMLFVMVMLLQSSQVTIGEFVMVVTLMFSIVGTLTFIGSTMNGFIRTYGDVEEGLNEIIVPHEITDFPKARELAVSGGAIEFNNIGFSYGTRRVFKDFSISFKSGERIGLVGPSGSGKTTFVSLLLRQHDVHEGEITIDGQNIRKVTQDSLRSAVSIVPQEPLLFHRTIRENIGYGKEDATQTEIEEAAKRAQAHDFILETPNGYDTLVGERGVKLSGGQRQRIAIARAILKAAPILVLDEATSSLDSESEVAIQKALEELMKGKTVIAIAHRLSTIRAMDRIIVLEGGEIVEDGTHDDLVNEGGTYARLWDHQAGGFLQDEEE